MKKTAQKPSQILQIEWETTHDSTGHSQGHVYGDMRTYYLPAALIKEYNKIKNSRLAPTGAVLDTLLQKNGAILYGKNASVHWKDGMPETAYDYDDKGNEIEQHNYSYTESGKMHSRWINNAPYSGMSSRTCYDINDKNIRVEFRDASSHSKQWQPLIGFTFMEFKQKDANTFALVKAEDDYNKAAPVPIVESFRYHLDTMLTGKPIHRSLQPKTVEVFIDFARDLRKTAMMRHEKMPNWENRKQLALTQ